MGLFENIFGRWKKKVAADGYFKTLTAYSPVYSSWGGEIYESELVRAAIHTRATHCGKLKVEITGRKKLQNRLKYKPNSWQTWTQFLYRLETIWDVQTTAFIVPVLDDFGEVTGIFPVLPSQCAMVDVDGVAFLRYKFRDGRYAAIEADRCGVMTKMQYEDDFFGSGNKALTPTMEMISVQEQGIVEATKSSGSYRFIARMSNFAKDEDISKERKRFNETNLRGEGGLLLFPNTYTDIKQIDSKPLTVDPEQMKFIRENVFEYFGVNEDVIQNKSFGDAWDAFYEGAVEPFAIQLSEVLTAMLFTEREQAQGAAVVVTSNRLQYMSVEDKIAFCKEMGDRGYILIDEGREIFQMAPLPDGKGQKAPIRGEYYFVGDKKKKEGEEDGNE